MAALSTYAGNAVLDALLNNAALQVATQFVSLHSGDPALNGANELSGNGYVRKTASFDAASAGATANSGAVTLGAASGDWSEATYWGVWDAESAGNFLLGAVLDSARTVLSGQYAEFAIGELDVTIGSQFGDDLEDEVLDAILRNVSLAVAQAYMSLHSADPGTTGASELSGDNYARASMSFGAAGSKSASSDADVDSQVASGDWAEATHLGLWDASSAGNFIWADILTAARTVQSGKFFRSSTGDVVMNVT